MLQDSAKSATRTVLSRIFVSTILLLLAVHSSAHSRVMLGAFVPGNGWKQENIYSLNNKLQKKLSFINLFSAFSEDWDQLYWQTSKVANAGMVPMISWMPLDQNRKDTNILPEITAGLWDEYLIEWSSRFKAWRSNYDEHAMPTILLRFGHEFNGNWYSYSDTPDAYKNAYRYIHHLFEQQGINGYIEWVWCANNLNIDSTNDITRYYPGDDYVDWTSIDGYNWGTNYSWTDWESFTDVYADTYSTLVTNYPDKPILIAEFGSAEPQDVPDPAWGQNGDNSDISKNKDVWSNNMLVALEEHFPAIRAIALFNINKELGWSITESQNTGLSGMNLGLSSDYYVSWFLSARDDGRAGTEKPESKTEGSAEPPIAFAYGYNVISPEMQKRLAESRPLPPVKRENVDKTRQGFLSMSNVDKAQLSKSKLSVLDEK